MAQAEQFWGSAWYYNPPRWRTPDGYTPWPVFWAYWAAMPSIRALGRVEASQAVRIAQADREDAHRVLAEWERVIQGG